MFRLVIRSPEQTSTQPRHSKLYLGPSRRELWPSFTIAAIVYSAALFLRKKLKREPVGVWQRSTRENSSVTTSPCAHSLETPAVLWPWRENPCAKGLECWREGLLGESQRALDTNAPEGFIRNRQILRQLSCPSKHVLPRCLVTGQTNYATSHRGTLFSVKKKWAGASLVVQWLPTWSSQFWGPGFDP